MSGNDLLNVADCARRLGISRQRLSKLLDEHGTEKVRTGRGALVSLSDAQRVVQIAASEGKLRTPRAHKDANEESELVSLLKEQVQELKTERERLLDKIEAMSHLESEVKLLKAAKEDLEQKLGKADKSFVSRIGKAISAFRE
jgi:DNA-binding transcriptional MerR regulator